MTIPEALQDLLTITTLSQVTPARVQAWQAAVRQLAGPPVSHEPTPPADDDDPEN